MKVLIVNTIHPSLQDMLENAGWQCEVMPSDLVSEQQVSERLAAEGFDGLVLRSGVKVTAAMIDANPQLRFIGRVGAGLEHIDVKYAQERGIEVLSSPEGNRQAVAEHALGSLLSLLNHIPTADREVRTGNWIRKPNEGEELAGKTVAIIGYGNTGSAFGELLKGFGVKALAYDKYIRDFGTAELEEVDMDEVADRADVVSLHLPYNDETHHLVQRDWINRFRKPVFLINTSRGGIVRTADLLDALDEGKVKGACLDVLEYESETLQMPTLDALPQDAKRLFEHDRVILTPHIAGLTRESYEKLSRILAQKILDRFTHA